MEFTSSNPPSFLNLEIQKAINEAVPTFDSYFGLLDKINQDIRSLESFLLAKGITTEARRCFYDGENLSDHVEWSFDEGSQKFRLLHSVYTWEESGDAEDNHLPGKEVRKLKSRTPLIESPTEIRVRSFEALPNLIRTLRFEINKIQESFSRGYVPERDEQEESPTMEKQAEPEANESSAADLHRMLDS